MYQYFAKMNLFSHNYQKLCNQFYDECENFAFYAFEQGMTYYEKIGKMNKNLILKNNACENHFLIDIDISATISKDNNTSKTIGWQ